MIDAKPEQTAVNGSGTASDSGMKLTSACSVDVHALVAMSKRHGDTPLGHRFLNVAQKLKARAECQDLARSAAIERSMRRDLAEIAALQGAA